MIINFRRLLICLLIYALALSILISGCTLPGRRKEGPKIEMIVDNPLPVKRTDEFVVFKVADLKEIAPDFSPEAFFVLQADSNQEIPNQSDDIDNDGERDEIAMIMDMEPMERKRIVIHYPPEGSPGFRAISLGFKKRTRAAIHPEYQGIGWESELIAYTAHPDYRNSISVFGKQESGLSLDKLAFSAMDKGYDRLEPWGVRVLNGGNSVGCGGFGLWHQGRFVKPLNMVGRSFPKPDERVATYTRIVADGPIRSVVQVTFDNWRVGNQSLKVTATYCIFAGQHWTRGEIKIERADHPVKVAAGVMKSETGTLTRDEENGFFYTWGAQSHRDTPDDLGMAVIYPTENFDSFHESVDHAASLFGDEPGMYLAVLNPGADNEITYWFLAAWNRGDIGMKKDSQFAELVSSIAQRIKHPLTVTIMPIKQRQTQEVPQEAN
jgi:hypothetical protein